MLMPAGLFLNSTIQWRRAVGTRITTEIHGCTWVCVSKRTSIGAKWIKIRVIWWRTWKMQTFFFSVHIVLKCHTKGFGQWELRLCQLFVASCLFIINIVVIIIISAVWGSWIFAGIFVLFPKCGQLSTVEVTTGGPQHFSLHKIYFAVGWKHKR